MKPYQINSFISEVLEIPSFLIAISLLTFGFDWIKNKFSLRPFLFPAEE